MFKVLIGFKQTWGYDEGKEHKAGDIVDEGIHARFRKFLLANGFIAPVEDAVSVDESVEDLSEKGVRELRDMAVVAGMDADDAKKLKKAELIDILEG